MFSVAFPLRLGFVGIPIASSPLCDFFSFSPLAYSLTKRVAARLIAHARGKSSIIYIRSVRTGLARYIALSPRITDLHKILLLTIVVIIAVVITRHVDPTSARSIAGTRWRFQARVVQRQAAYPLGCRY